MPTRTALSQLEARGEHADYPTFVPSGEPTLDRNLGETIYRLKAFGIPVAVVANGSLLWRPQALLARYGAEWAVVDRLVEEGRLLRTSYRGRVHYRRGSP